MSQPSDSALPCIINSLHTVSAQFILSGKDEIAFCRPKSVKLFFQISRDHSCDGERFTRWVKNSSSSRSSGFSNYRCCWFYFDYLAGIQIKTSLTCNKPAVRCLVKLTYEGIYAAVFRIGNLLSILLRLSKFSFIQMFVKIEWHSLGGHCRTRLPGGGEDHAINWAKMLRHG